jgi:hypothetical protein
MQGVHDSKSTSTWDLISFPSILPLLASSPQANGSISIDTNTAYLQNASHLASMYVLQMNGFNETLKEFQPPDTEQSGLCSASPGYF